jgi:propanediol dehydratase large subunit
VAPDAPLGLVAMNGPADPEAELAVDGGRVLTMDGRREDEFDVIDRFIVRYGLDLDAARQAASLTDAEIARRLVDVGVPRAELVRLSRGLTPARLARVVGMLDPVELMFALKKLRARRRPANQAHVTNLKENPALLAADGAEAALRGFAEVETTVGVSRYAPLNAIAILVGSQTGRPGVMTQCAVEERRNLQLALQGLVTYAETLSVYGTEPVFVDGDDTPWSKALLASAYASRGVKVRFTSGGGSEALMGRRGAWPWRGPPGRRASRTARSRASRSRSRFRAGPGRSWPRMSWRPGSTSRWRRATTRSPRTRRSGRRRS